MFVHNFDPVLLSLGPLEIRYYGLVYVLGFLLGIWYVTKLSEEGAINLTKDQVYDLFTWLIVALVAGARLMEVIFYEPAYYFSNPLKILYIWEGGLSFHGGAIGVMLVAWWYAKKHKVPFYSLTDALVVPASLILVLGRIANFLNGELVGRVTDVSWGFQFKGYEGFRHPSQLYEAFKNLVIFSTLMFIKNLKPKPGVLSWSFVLMYGVLRFTVEFFREPNWMFMGVTPAQWLSIIIVPIAGYMLYITLKK